VWAKLDSSWYISGGKIVNNWGGSTVSYWWRTRKVDRHSVALEDASGTTAKPPSAQTGKERRAVAG